ncbi:hypothetical protein FB566_4505 [Stackebrandtia endophytica]|uniref:Uncharacterized protein n=1 Tax=Stackebrandtia endophytica TaxID=1496996 RepID=A0A543B242_9ACTN|nr:hypothetical protein [Stackebrandtia endophytica]TQL78908.1 hypothetical protein FB566_4505 [Stackebrandtia endophytica]
MITRMWEVRAEPTRFDALLDWVRDDALPTVSGPSLVSSQVYRSEDHRIVVITTFDGAVVDLPEPPAGLAARPPHAWTFTRVD